MKPNASLLRNVASWWIVLCTTFVVANAATLPTDAPLQLKADDAAPMVATLPAGSSVEALSRDVLETEGIGALPAGWVAVRYSGPVYGYAMNSAVGKDFTLKPGAMIRAQPTNEAQMFSIVGEGDTAEVVELAGDWSKVVFEKSMILFLDLGEAAPVTQAQEIVSEADSAAAAAAVEASATAEVHEAVAPAAPPVAKPAVEATPRVFQGYLSRTRRIFGAGPKLDYQLLDQNNKRMALLDLSALLLTDPIDRLEDRYVSVFGLPTRREGTKDMVIRVETIRLLN